MHPLLRERETAEEDIQDEDMLDLKDLGEIKASFGILTIYEGKVHILTG
jgi:hypothetical protein